MLTTYRADNGRLVRTNLENAQPLDQEAVWFDLLEPSRAEERIVEGLLGIEVPTREEMQEIEVSSRLYEEDGALFMTAQMIWRVETEKPENTTVTFVLAKGRLVTLRYADPLPFRTFLHKVDKHPSLCQSGETVMLGLLDGIVDRMADILEQIGARVDSVSAEIFHQGGTVKHRSRNLQEQIRQLGRHGDLTSKAREALISMDRLVTFLNQATFGQGRKDMRTRTKTLSRDLQSLSDYATFLANKVTFLLDATLGLISIEQTNIIKMFSVAAVAFLPPTLIASIYGMNFDFMPETHWKLGYPLSILLMLISAAAPFVYFRKRGWI